MAEDKSIIVVKKKKGGHGGAHGGAWKIAYADFVTAMMAFFMVMWLLNTTEAPTRVAIASYFRKPGIFHDNTGRAVVTGSAGILPEGMPPAEHVGENEYNGKVQAPPKSQEESDEETLAKAINGKIKELKLLVKKSEELGANSPQAVKAINTVENIENIKAQHKQLTAISEKIKQLIMEAPELKKILGELDVKVTPDGLTIEIMDSDKISMFSSGSATILKDAEAAFGKLAELLKPLNGPIDVIGHTDSIPYQTVDGNYTNWELSSDRANAARRLLISYGLKPDRFINVIGRADKDPKIKTDPKASSNRRITLKIRFGIDDSQRVKLTNELLNTLNQELNNSSKPTNRATNPIEIIRPTQNTTNDIINKNDPSVDDELSQDLTENPLITPSDIFDY